MLERYPYATSMVARALSTSHPFHLLPISIWLAYACQPPDAPSQNPTTTSESTGGSSTATSDTDEPTSITPDPATSEHLSTTSSSDPTTTTSSPPTSICGDAVLDLGEQCDHGFAFNNDTNACTMTCQRAVCGDGLVWAGTEQCDHGPDNNDTLYNACTTSCTLGDHCGDSTVQAPEECDYGNANGTDEMPTGGVPCTTGCRLAAKITFVTSTLHTGDLGGESGAHLRCQLAATAAGLDNAPAFKAWISVGGASPSSTFEYGTPAEDIPYVLPDGTRLAFNYTDLISHGPGDGIIMTETKDLVLERPVWTGTDPDGTPFNPVQDCEGWTNASLAAKGRAGSTGVDKANTVEWNKWKAEQRWTTAVTDHCLSSYRLYCFEQ